MSQSVDSNGALTYQYDAEGRMISVDGVAGQSCQSTWTECLTYNALGQRVEWMAPSSSWGRDLVYGAGGAEVARFNPLQGWWVSYEFHPGGDWVYMGYYSGYEDLHRNALGSTGMTTSQAGAVTGDDVYYPWGDVAQGGQSDVFAGMARRDNYSGLDPAFFRHYSSTLGRWMTPDPSGMASVSLTNPQTWNMYAYVTNNPTTFTDPTGLSGGYYTPGPAQTCSGNQVPSQYASNCASATIAAVAAAEAINSNGDCMQYEYGCAGSNSQLAAGEANFENWEQQQVLQSAGVRYGANGQLQTYLAGSSVCTSGGSCSYQNAAWVNVSDVKDLPESTQNLLALEAGGILAAPAVNDAAIGTAALIALPYTMTGVAEVGTAAMAIPYLQYQAVQFTVSFTSTVVNGPTHLPSDWTSPGAWVGWAAGSLAWWEQ